MDKISNLKKEIINTLDSNKALDIVSIDLEGKSSIADFMIIASGTSSRHIQSLAERVVEDLKKLNIRPLSLEGEGTQEWVLVDYGDVIVHLMSAQARTFYDLESLWDEDI